jgi:alpha-glucosidase (family GH31 glycosyl hydrolase)
VLWLCCAPAFRAATAAGGGLRVGGAPVELTVWQVSDRSVRVESAPLDAQGRAQPAPPSPCLISVPSIQKLSIRELPDSRQLACGNLRVILEPRPLRLTVRRADGTLVQELIFNEQSVSNLIRFRAGAPVLGLGEGAEQFDRRGFNYPLLNGQRYRLAEFGARVFSPYLIGTDGWALWIRPPSGSFDLRGERGAFSPLPDSTPGCVDVFVIDAREPADAMREFIRMTGAPVMPPKWALGYMQSHRTLSSDADILAEAARFRRDQLPCDVFIFLGTGFCPAGWNRGHDSFVFNTNVFHRDPAAVIADLHAEHLHVALHVVPLQKDYPELHGDIPPGPGQDLDDRHIAEYWARHRQLVADGVDGWWPDEGDWFDVPSRLARHRMYYEGPLSDRPGVRPWNLQRNGCPGIARYGGWIWSGDILSSWKTLAAQVAVGLNSSLSVSPYWGTDIGGFYPSRDREYTGELYVRWFQFAAFCPSFRSHGRTWHLHLPWGWNTGETGPVESRPTPDPSELHNAAVEPVCRRYLDLRYELLPYTYTITRQAHDSGMPLMRALWLHYPRDAEAVKLGSEFLWGRDLLIAPVVEKGARLRRVYLPAGTWYDWWTGKAQPGGRWVERAVDLATMPMYVRAGAVIPLDPVRQYVGQPVTDPTRLRVYPGADGSFSFYDDDGASLDYLNDADPGIIRIRMEWRDSTRQLTLQPDARSGGWHGGAKAFAVECVGRDIKPRLVEYRGTPVEVDL